MRREQRGGKEPFMLQMKRQREVGGETETERWRRWVAEGDGGRADRVA